MAGTGRKAKKVSKQEPPIKRGQHSQPNQSGVPSTGGSRQGNIGHQERDNSDNSHR